MMIDIDKYRDPWLFENVSNAIGFYTREFYCLDNFSSFKVNYNGFTYATVEEAYQAAKFETTAPDVVEQIRNCFSAHDSKKIAHDNADKQRADWEDVKTAVMEEILRAKVQRHPYVLQKLLATLDYPIVEDSPVDSFWGCGADRCGQNVLGKLWMKIRDDIK